MRKVMSLVLATMILVAGVNAFAKGNGAGMKNGSAKSYSGASTQNGFKTGDRALDGSGKGYGDGTKPQPKDGTGFGAKAK